MSAKEILKGDALEAKFQTFPKYVQAGLQRQITAHVRAASMDAMQLVLTQLKKDSSRDPVEVVRTIIENMVKVWALLDAEEEVREAPARREGSL